ncbi:MAG: neutral/alkaline non-lysosomal ceramidase N-terminal domain-containing protein [Candidatus Omnitrophica bacterium]|nr:neutral/alkaline non-lysosomal ceramidase N-terminal domain-containing protein [Candidatus Omnitrophota bacterium]
MRLNRFRLLPLAIVAIACFATLPERSQAEKENDTFRAACVKVDITPETPQWLHGYGPRKSDGVHDKIYHRIVVMDDGSGPFVIVSTDVCTVDPDFFLETGSRLQEETGIAQDRFWWAATHTHAAPHVGPQKLSELFSNSLGDRFSMEHDVGHWRWVQDQLIEGVKEAQSRLEPARLGIGSGTSYANINRRGYNAEGKSILGVDPEGPVDRQIGLIRLERPDGSPIALIASYAMHGTVLGPRNTQISGDGPGIVAEFVESKVGAPMLYINGAEGNVAPIYSVRADFAHSHIGEFNYLLGLRILAVNQSIQETQSDVTLSVGKKVIETPRKEGLGWLEALEDYAGVGDDGRNLVLVPAYSLVINRDTAIWAAPLELFSEIALNVRASSPFERTFYYGLTNGSLLYMPTEKAFAEGGYEPSVSVFTPEVERDYTQGVTEYLQALARK